MILPSARELPAHLEVLYSREQIERKISELAPVIDRWAVESLEVSGQPLLMVCILRGGVFFFSDLLLSMRQSVEPGFLRASSYATTRNGAPAADLVFDSHGLNVKGRSIVLVDNICDSGRTLETVSRTLSADGAMMVRTVVLVHRLRSDSCHAPTLFGYVFEQPDWLAGYGLRDRQACMNFPEVYRVRPS